MYRAVMYFTDLTDNGHAYHTGDEFPRAGLKVSKERLEALSTSKNRRRIPLIENVEEAEKDEEAEPAKDEKTKKATRKKA